MATNNSIGLNIELPIYNSNGSSFHGLVLHKCTYDSVVMSLGDKITGDVYYNGNTLAVTMQEYVELDGVKFVLVTPPTVVREGMVSENSQLNGMTKYSFVFYHPMYMLGNFPFTDVAVTSSEAKYLSESKKFTWIGYPDDFIAKVNKNLDGTEWIVEKSSRFPAYLDDQLSDVLPFDGNTIADACKTFYDTWGAPYIVAKVESTEAAYANGKRFKVIFGLPSNEIYEDATHQQSGTPYIFRFGKGVGLKNNSRTPRGNKIVTRIAGSGSENNIPYGYPQIPWYGDSRWDYTEYEGSTINYDSDGHVTNTPKTTAYPLYMGIVGGAYVKLIKHPFTRTNLMPSIYGQTLFNKVSPYLSDGTANPDYDPNTTLIDYYDAIATQEYPYPNPIVANAPSYESHQFEDIKPELGQNVAIVDAYPVNKDMTPAQAWDDSMDDDGNYVQSYFKMQLPVLSFDLYACAAITQEMQINMRSGACLGCTFTVQVDWDDYKRNFYDEDGNFAPTGSQRDYTKYPDSTQEQITVVLQKETATFGTLMPNMYQYPVADDTFVVLGISLPLSYIESAEERLDGEMKSYMLENNVHYFDYPLKFDEAFLRNNPYILSQIKPNSVVRFKYGNDTMQLFVKQMSVKYGEGVLPKYDITLTDNVEVVLNRIGQVAEDVEKLASLIAILRQNYNRSVWNELAKKLSKAQDDTAAGYITMLKGLQIGASFVPDILGEGGVLRMREDGKVELVTDILYARVKAYFDSVEIREYQHTGGNRIASVAGNKICRVAWFNSSNVELEQTQANLASVAYFRCYFRASDGEDTVRNNWVVGDQAYCHITSVTTSSDNPEQKGLNQKHLWRLVIGRNTEGTLTEDGEGYIDLSNRSTETISSESYAGYQSSSDTPAAQDDIIQLGNVNDTTRQGAIVEFVTGTDAPSYQIYQGINSFSLNGKNQIGFGYNTSTGRAYLNVFGDFRFGARPNTQGSYLEYNAQTGALNIKAHVEFTNTDQELNTLVQSHQRDDRYDDSWIQPALDELQGQIDGQIDSWFYNYSPVHVDAQGAPDSTVPLNVEPYSDWDTDDKKIAHLGDTFTNNTTGYCWRFSRNSETNAFEWVIIEDSAVITALQNAARAQETADGKRTTYSVWGAWIKNNVNTLKTGDLFIPAADTTQGGVTYKARKVYKCTTDGSATFNEIDYTDDTYAHNFDYLKAAMKGDTQIQGGLLLSNAVVLRNVEQGVSTDIMSGINGVLNTDLVNPLKSIAAWYGGDMLDREAASDSSSSSSEEEEEPRYATSLFRFDGSGYLASGNITWNDQGQITIKNITTLSDSQNTNLLNELATFNSAFHFTTGGQGGTTILSIDPQVQFSSLHIGGSTDDYLAATRKWVGDNYISKTWFNNILKVHYKATAGGADTILSPNNSLPSGAVDVSLESVFSFWTNYAISALGQGVDGSHAIGSLDDLSDVELTSPAADQILKFNGTYWVNAAAPQTYVLPQATSGALGGIKIGYNDSTPKTYAVALNSAGQAYVAVHYAWGDISNKPTTISGYGITDAYTKTQVDSLVRLKSVALASDGVLAFELQDGSVSYADLTHQHEFLELIDKPTTLAGFGITDAKIESGVITLGGNTITPVTSVAMTVPTGFSISGTPISKTGTLALSYSSGFEGFTTELKNMITALYSWFEVDSNGDIKTKDYTSNGTTKHRGFWSPTFISALGQGSDSGGGGTGDVTWELLKSQATNDRYIHLSYISTALASYLAANNYIQSSAISDMATKTWVGNQGYLTQQSLSNYYTKPQVDALARLTNVAYSSDGILAFTHQDGSTTYADFTHEHSFLELLDKPTTIAGYEISDAYINNGVVYLGNNSITPVTSVAMTVPTGFSISGSPISKTGTLAVSYASGYEGFTTSLKEKIEALFSWFELDSDGNVKTKDYYDNGTTKHRGFWSESFISALGEGNDGGGGGQGDVTWDLLKSSDTRQINISHLAGDANYAGVMSILTGYTTSGKNYKVQEDSNHHLYVNVPWTDNNTTYTNGTGLSLSGTTFGINSTYQTYISNGNTAYSWGNHANAGYALQTSLNALEYFNSITGGSDIITITTNKSNSTVIDLTHQHSFQELTDKPTTIAGYGITDVYSWARQSTKPSYAFSEITGTATANQIPSIQNINSFGTYVYSAQISRTANTVLAAPNGSAGVASFRSLVAADIPSLSWSKITSGKPTTLSGYGITDACTQSTANGLLYTMSLNNDGTINVITLGGTTKYSIDFTHQHSFLELVDRPATTDGYGITGGKMTGNLYVLGNVGVGTSSPSYKLHVNGESYFANWMFVNSSVTALGIELQPSSSSAGHGGHIDFHYNKSSADYTTRLIEDASGRLKLIGDFYATGGVTALVATSSDIRKKNVVSYNLPLTLNQIADAPTIKFTWKDNAKLGEQVGSIAQYWQKVLPQTIRTEKDDTLSLQYGVAALVATITTARKVVDHEKRISELEKENKELREEISRLKIA